jgi:hypothetical protein
LKKYSAYYPTLILVLSAAASAATPAIATFWASHAAAAAVIAPLAIAVAHWLPSPAPLNNPAVKETANQ